MGVNKVKAIIDNTFDSRMGIAVIQYMLQQIGMDNCAKITDEEIESIKGNAFMTDEFCQAMVRTAREIAKECNFINDVIPYLFDEYGHLSGRITQKRTEEILIRYIDNDLNSADPAYVREVLRDVCDCTYDELQDLGIDGWFDFDEEEETE